MMSFRLVELGTLNKPFYFEMRKFCREGEECQMGKKFPPDASEIYYITWIAKANMNSTNLC